MSRMCVPCPRAGIIKDSTIPSTLEGSDLHLQIWRLEDYFYYMSKNTFSCLHMYIIWTNISIMWHNIIRSVSGFSGGPHGLRKTLRKVCGRSDRLMCFPSCEERKGQDHTMSPEMHLHSAFYFTGELCCGVKHQT